jgi:hypothetical protein
MPPQVGKAGDGSGRATITPESGPATTNTVGSAAPAEKPQKAEPEVPKQDPKAAAKNAEGSKQHATEKRNDHHMQGQVVKDQLAKQVPRKENGGSPEPAKGGKRTDKATAPGNPAQPKTTAKPSPAYGWANLKSDLGDATASAAKASKTEKATAQGKPAQPKATAKQSEGNVWESVKGAARFAADAANAGARAIGDTTAKAAAANLAEQTDSNIQKASENAHKITNEQAVKEFKAEVHVAAFGRPNPEYKTVERMVGSELAAETGVPSTLKPAFEDSEKVIQKMVDYSRDSKNGLPTVSPRSMDLLLGPYGHYNTYKGGGEVQKQILDAALHNWRNTPPEARQALHARDKDSPALRNDDYAKAWIKIPLPSAEDIRKDEQIDENQVVFEDAKPGRHGIPYHGTVGERPDPVMNYEQAKKDFTQAGFDVINSIGITRGTPEPSPTLFEAPGGKISGAPVEPSRSAPAPERNVAQEMPGSQPAANKPQPQSQKSTETNSSKQIGHYGVKDGAAKTETKEAKLPNTNQMSKPSRPPEEIQRDLRTTQKALEEKRAEEGIRDLIREGVEQELKRKPRSSQVEPLLEEIVQNGNRPEATPEDVRRAEQASEYLRQIGSLRDRLSELNEEQRRAK